MVNKISTVISVFIKGNRLAIKQYFNKEYHKRNEVWRTLPIGYNFFEV